MERKWWTLVAVCVGVFMLLLDITIVNVALPQIEKAFHAQLSDLQWVIDAYALTLASLLLTSGSLADRFGRRLVFAIGLVIFTAGSLLCGVSTGSLFLILARAFQGIGGAIMFATSLALLANAFQGRERGTAFAVFGAVTGVAIAVGPVLGGVITSGISWRWIFFVNVPIGVVALAVTLIQVDESRMPHAGRIDWVGLISFSLALAGLVYGLIESSRIGWSSGTVIGSLVAAGALLVVFFVAELRQEHPMLDLSLLRLPTFTGGLIAAFAINCGLFALFTYIVIYMQNLLGLSAVGTGLRFLLLTGATFVTAGVAGRLTNSVPIRFLIAPGFVLVGIGLVLMHGVTPTSSWTHFIPGFIVAGVGSGLINVPLASTAVGVVEPARAGMASGINSTLRQIGTATGVAALGSVFAGTVRSQVANHLAATPLKPFAHQIANAVASGGGSGGAPAGVPASAQAIVRPIAVSGFVTGLNDILLIGAVASFIAAVACVFLIRQKDFHAAASGHSGVSGGGEAGAGAAGGGAGEGSAEGGCGARPPHPVAIA
jgi:EmrB/QacA subfamily drug resistance transporter